MLPVGTFFSSAFRALRAEVVEMTGYLSLAVTLRSAGKGTSSKLSAFGLLRSVPLANIAIVFGPLRDGATPPDRVRP